MTSAYVAWDGNEYPWPPPSGWYRGSDGRWWPEGHGPGADQAVATPETAAEATPSIPAAPSVESFRPPAVASEPVAPPVASAVDSAELGSASLPPGSTPSSRSNGRGPFLAAIGIGVVLVAVVAGVFAFLGSTDTVDDAVATTIPATTDEDFVTTTSAPGATTTSIRTGRGSASEPYEIGESFEIRYQLFDEDEKVWAMSVVGPAVDQTDAVLAENQFNEPPPEGQRFMVAPMRITYVSGPELSDLFDFSFKAIGSERVVRTTFDPSCGVLPNGLDVLGELGPGGTLEGTVCWVVPEDEIGTHVMAIEVFFSDLDTWVELTE